MSQPNPPADLSATLQHAGFAERPERAFLRITGGDATRWLNGMVTNSAQALAPGEGNYNFLLNAQGRLQGDCLIFREPTATDKAEFLLVTEARQVEAIQAHLDRFIIMDDVELAPAFPDETSLQLLGPEAAQHLHALGLPGLPPAHLGYADSPHGPVLLFSAPPRRVPGFEMRAPAAVLFALGQRLRDAGVPELTQKTMDALRVLEGAPRFGTDIGNRDLPQEANQPHALHFAKGCYLGQEIVERVRSRGQVHRLLTPFTLQGSLPDLPAALEADGMPAGELTSAAEISSSAGSTVIALGFARREALDAGKVLRYANGVAQPRAAGHPR